MADNINVSITADATKLRSQLALAQADAIIRPARPSQPRTVELAPLSGGLTVKRVTSWSGHRLRHMAQALLGIHPFSLAVSRVFS